MSHPEILPKLCGADMELANFIAGVERPDGTGYHASRLLLAAMDGIPSMAATSLPDNAVPAGSASGHTLSETESVGSNAPTGYYSQDWGRKFLPNGGCAYVDLNHLEVHSEVISAYDHVACCHAMFRLARQAAASVDAHLPQGWKTVLLANSSDGLGHSYGVHLNYLISRRTFSDIFHWRLQFQLFLAAYQASSIIFTGLGKVGAENNRPAVPFQISQRADFLEILAGPHTTVHRPIVNSRDEPLCGTRAWNAVSHEDPASEMARLHVIFYDNNLCHTASLLKVGVMQIILAMIEAGSMNPQLILDNPVEALRQWSHDPNIQTQAPLVSGRDTTALELQFAFFDEARRFVRSGACAHAVPFATEILGLWGETLHQLKTRQFAALTRRLDWVLKRAILEQALQQNPHLNWASPEIKHLDHLYSNLDPHEGLYWAYERSGLVNRLVTEARVQHFQEEAPPNTRAWTRALLLRLADPAHVDRIDWDRLRFKFTSEDPTHLSRFRTLALANPLAFTQAHIEPGLPESGTLDDLLTALGADEEVDASDQAFLAPVASASARNFPAHSIDPNPSQS